MARWQTGGVELVEDLEGGSGPAPQRLGGGQRHKAIAPQEAAAASRRAIGNVLLARDDAREAWLGSWDTWWPIPTTGTAR